MKKRKNGKQKLILTSLLLATLGTGSVFASSDAQTRNNALDGIQAVDSIMANKVLAAGSHYDLRLYNYISEKNVGSTNENWAAATTRLLELSCKNGGDFSARHMDYATALNSTFEGTPNAHYRNLGSGGNAAVGLAYFTSGKGPIAETEMPWANNLNVVSLSSINKKASYKIEDYTKFPSIYKYRDYGYTTAWDRNSTIYTGGEVEKNRDNMKEQILQHGAVVAKIYRDNQYFKYYWTNGIENKSEQRTREYSSGSYTYTYKWQEQNFYSIPLTYYCTNKDATPNHEVVIIGWDDDYSNAHTGVPQRGAWIVMDAENFYATYNTLKTTKDSAWYYTGSRPEAWKWKGNDITVNTNCYYVPYDDYFIESNVYGIDKVSYIDYSSIYQHDPLGMSTSISASFGRNDCAYGANVFKRNTSIAQILNEISVASESPMKYEVYVNTRDGDLSFDKLTKVAETDYLTAGYHTIKISDLANNKQVVLTGEKFAVVVKYIAKIDDYISFSGVKIGVESPTEIYYQQKGDGWFIEKRSANYWQNASSAPYQSYIASYVNEYANDWKDLYDDENTKDMNICIKAFVTDYPGYKPPYEKVELNKTELTIVKGDTETLVAKVLPDIVIDDRVYWTTSDRSIATVDQDGNVTAVAGGTATITARSADASIYAECQVKVDVPVESLVLNQNEVTMLANQTYILAPIIGPEDATTKDVQWSSSNKEVCLVTDDGVLIGLKQGRAIITALIKDDYGMYTATCNVVVPESLLVEVTDVKLNKSTMTLEKGTRETLVATVYPEDATNKAVVWTSSNKSVAVVNANGRVTGLTAGTTKITATTVNGGEQAECIVTVTEVPVAAVSGISLDKAKLNLEKGDTSILIPTITPSNADNKAVTWSSDNEDVAVVGNNGKITAVGEGKATITVTTEDRKKTATCTVNVSLPYVEETGIKLNKTGTTVEVGDKLLLIADVLPYNATNTKVTWTSSDSRVATVDENGNVTAIAGGKATITAKTANGKYYKTCVIEVPTIIPVEGISFEEAETTMEVGRTMDLKAIITPTDATNQKINWTLEEVEVPTEETEETGDVSEGEEGASKEDEHIDDRPMAVVDNGKVIAFKTGTVLVTATTEDGKKTATCKVTITEQTSEIQMTTNIGLVDMNKTISEIPGNTTVKEFEEGIITNGTVTVLDTKGNVVANTVNIGTGMTVQVTKVTEDGETITENYSVMITGDLVTVKTNEDGTKEYLPGDGKVTREDIDMLIKIVLKEETIDEKYIDVMDLNHDGKINVVDLDMLKDIVEG